MKQHFFLRNRYIGEVEREGYYTLGELRIPSGTAYFCPLCSEVWFNAPVEGQFTQVLSHPCEKHKLGDQLGSMILYDIPGIIHQHGIMPDMLAFMPKALLDWDFFLLLSLYDKELS